MHIWCFDNRSSSYYKDTIYKHIPLDIPILKKTSNERLCIAKMTHYNLIPSYDHISILFISCMYPMTQNDTK